MSRNIIECKIKRKLKKLEDFARKKYVENGWLLLNYIITWRHIITWFKLLSFELEINHVCCLYGKYLVCLTCAMHGNKSYFYFILTLHPFTLDCNLPKVVNFSRRTKLLDAVLILLLSCNTAWCAIVILIVLLETFLLILCRKM